jgi:uncharacterized SAM-binding protein YcdF (DUF218 family)
MSTLSDLTLRQALADSALRESLLATVAMLLLSGGLTLVLTWLWVMRQALRSPEAAEVDWLVVCGYVLEAGRPSPVFTTRLRRAAQLAGERPEAGLMIAGGGEPSEAAVGRDWLVSRAGLSPERIVLEEASMDTFENLRHARELLPSGARLGLVTSRFHLARVLAYAGQLDLRAVPLPAEPRWHSTAANWTGSFREAVFLCWFFSGRFWARLARRRRLLERIR